MCLGGGEGEVTARIEPRIILDDINYIHNCNGLLHFTTLYYRPFFHFTTLLPVVYDSVNGLDSPCTAARSQEHLLLKDVAHNLSHLTNIMGV